MTVVAVVNVTTTGSGLRFGGGFGGIGGGGGGGGIRRFRRVVVVGSELNSYNFRNINNIFVKGHPRG